jgi:hypothetical protein
MTLQRWFVLAPAATIVVWLALAGPGAPTAKAAPTIIYDCAPAPLNCTGWYRSPVSIDWTVVGATEPLTGCADTTIVDDTKGSSQVCSATDGIRVTIEVPIKVDKTPPTVTGASLSRPPDGNGWYRLPVQVTYGGNDATSGLSHCSTTTYAGPDSASASAAGTCTDVAGNTSAPFGQPLRFDSTGPVVRTGKPARKPDRRGWYTRPVRWSFTGSDALSGLADCPAVRYAGPDGAAARVAGGCVDRAGNVNFRSFPIRYDDTAPPAPDVRALPRDRAVRLKIRVVSDVRRIRVVRTPGRGGARSSTIYRGRPRNLKDLRVRNYRRYRYSVVAIDRVGHRSPKGSASALPKPELLAPPNGAVLTSPPLLRWSTIRGADYYNVQLLRDGRKVLSEWPTRARLQLKRRWRFEGRVRRMRPATYEWNVWPGYGPRRAARYGRRIGKRTFVIPGAPPAP